MPHISVSSTSRHAHDTALERIRQKSKEGLDVAAFFNEINPIVGRLVPNGTESIDSPYWFTVDPGSHLATSIYGQGCDVDPADYMRWELEADDYMKSADVLLDPAGTQTLHQVTEGRPERSPIYLEVMEPNGISQELLVALRTSGGESWGTTRLNRSPGDPQFSEIEIDFMSQASPLIAEGVRRGLLVGEARSPEHANSPGLVVVDPDGGLESMSPGAEEWFSRLPDDDGRHDGVPTSVLAVAAGTFGRSGSRAQGESWVRVPTKDGSWALIQGILMETNGDPKIMVIIQPADPDNIAPLLMSIYGLTTREQEVTRLVLLGGPTNEIGRELGVSPHTVQQHLKNIFEKTDVRSRGELIAKVYFDCYDLRVRDNRERIRSEASIRGGPKANS